jgi:glycine/D-amino acid oxidase-like deaminating enzyme
MISQPHISSYYAATANTRTDFAPLRGTKQADVCVIGAGFTGISTALDLAERGYNVHVVEANKVAWGASGRNGGQMVAGIAGEARIEKALGKGGAEPLWEMRWAGHDIIRRRIERYGIECDLKYGYADVAIKQRDIRTLQMDLERLERHDFPHHYRLLGREETCETIGSQAYIAALVNMGDGHLHPLNLCIGEANAAVTNGVTIYEDSPAVRIDYGSRPTVVTDHGSVSADFVVLAGNAYHQLARKLRRVMLPVNSYIIATEPLTAELVESVNPLDLAVSDLKYVIEYYRLSADKRLLFGGRCNYFGDEPAFIERGLRPRMLKVYPQLASVSIDYAWGGRIGVPLHRVPQIGRLAPNVFYSQGYTGHGINVTHIAGQILADAIAGTFERFDLFSSIKPMPLPGAHSFSKPLAKLAILYYQIRDKL